MAATPNQCAPINMYVIQNAKWQPQEKQEEEEKLTSSLLISTKTHGQALCLLVERYTGEPIYGPWFCYLGRNQGRWEYSTFLGKTVSTSVRIKNLPSIILPYTAKDIYPKALSVVSLKYTKAKLKFVKAKCHRLFDHAAGATYSLLTWKMHIQLAIPPEALLCTFSTRITPGVIQIHKYIQPLPCTCFPGLGF